MIRHQHLFAVDGLLVDRSIKLTAITSSVQAFHDTRQVDLAHKIAASASSGAFACNSYIALSDGPQS